MPARFDTLEPASHPALRHASVVTEIGGDQPRQIEYTIPGLSGASAHHFGLGPQEIAWLLIAEAATVAGLETFEAALRGYIGAGVFLLVTESGRAINKVRLTGVTPLEEERRTAGDGWLRTYRVAFRAMQPPPGTAP